MCPKPLRVACKPVALAEVNDKADPRVRLCFWGCLPEVTGPSGNSSCTSFAGFLRDRHPQQSRIWVTLSRGGLLHPIRYRSTDTDMARFHVGRSSGASLPAPSRRVMSLSSRLSIQPLETIPAPRQVHGGCTPGCGAHSSAELGAGVKRASLDALITFQGCASQQQNSI